MTNFKSILIRSALTGAIALGALAAGVGAASADVACNRYGECWNVRDHYTNYPADLGVVFHDEAWRVAHPHDYHWRRDVPDDHGYYTHGAWHPF